MSQALGGANRALGLLSLGTVTHSLTVAIPCCIVLHAIARSLGSLPDNTCMYTSHSAMMSEMRLGPERQAGWLLRLPRTPLDMRGDPDTIAALRLATEAAGLPPMAPGKAAAMLAAAAEAACKAAAEDEEGGAGSDALGASAVSVPGVPQELAPLLRCVRCTSPWCHPGRRGAALLCPFGHMWR